MQDYIFGHLQVRESGYKLSRGLCCHGLRPADSQVPSESPQDSDDGDELYRETKNFHEMGGGEKYLISP